MRMIRSAVNTCYKSIILPRLIKHKLIQNKLTMINIGSGAIALEGYWNIDISHRADLIIDLDYNLLPFQDDSLDVAVCISAINYLTRDRAQLLIQDVWRTLKPGGIARFASQDLRMIAQKYVENDQTFFSQLLPNGKHRFPGRTNADKINAWFYGHPTSGNKVCRYFYDYETLADLFEVARFSHVQKKAYQESTLPDVGLIDNRPDQMFFLEAVK